MDGFLIHVPRAGLIRGTRGFFLFALTWTLGSGAIVTVFALISASGTPSAPPLWWFGIFPLAGLAMLLISVHSGYRQTWVAVRGDRVGLRDQSPLRKFERRLSRTEIGNVRMGPTGVEVNGRPVMELQFIMQDGRKVGCCSQLSEPELSWLAELLRRRLGISSETVGAHPGNAVHAASEKPQTQ